MSIKGAHLSQLLRVQLTFSLHAEGYHSQPPIACEVYRLVLLLLLMVPLMCRGPHFVFPYLCFFLCIDFSLSLLIVSFFKLINAFNGTINCGK